MTITATTAKAPVAATTKDALVETVTQDLPTIGKGIAQGDAKKVGSGLLELTDDFVSGTVGRVGHLLGDLGKLLGVPGSKDLAKWGEDRWQNGGVVKKDVPAAAKDVVDTVKAGVKTLDQGAATLKQNDPAFYDRFHNGSIR